MNGYPGLGFEPSGIDAIDRRRMNALDFGREGMDFGVGQRPPQRPQPFGPPASPPMQRPPAAPLAAAAPAGGGVVGNYGGAGTYASTGDPMLDVIRNTTMADALARARGTRAAAIRAGGDDPSMAAYGGLAGLLEGQGDAATSLNRGALARLSELDARRFQERMLRLQHEWEMEQQRQAAEAALWGAGGGLLGRAAGSWIGGG